MVKWIRFLKFLGKTDSNWCATLDSIIQRNEIRNIIDSNVDNDPNEKTCQLAWAWSGSQKNKTKSVSHAAEWSVRTFFVVCATRKLQFWSAVIGQFKTSPTNQMSPAVCGFPAKVSCAFSGLYYLCFKIRHFMWILS